MRVIFLSEKDKDRWNKFILDNRGSFLQSFEWGQIQEKMGWSVWRMWLRDEKIDENRPIFAAQIIRNDLPFIKKSYLYSPHGPVYRRGVIEKINNIYGDYIAKKKEYFDEFLKVASDLCKKENAIFFKMEPLLKSELHRKYLAETDLKKSNKEIQPSETVILDLQKSEEELLSEMKSKTRYNINLAQKHRVEIVKSQDSVQFDKFWDLMEETAKRDKFSAHSKEYYKKILETKGENFKNEIYLAIWDGNVLATAIVNFFNGRATYLHGASSSENRNVMAPYLLHWEIIKDAKNAGFREYDFWGISKKWPGVTRFKQGFGGAEKKYLGAFDLAVDRFWYFVYSLARKVL